MPAKKIKERTGKRTASEKPKLEKAMKQASPKVKQDKKSTQKSIERGSQVRLDYTGKLESGEVFDTSAGKHPLEFVLGSGQIIPGLEKGLLGMKNGEKKTIAVIPEEAYGQPNPTLVQELPKGPLPPNMELKVGMVLLIRTPDGHPMPVKVNEVKDATVVLDFNHPLAGKKLFFEVDILNVI
jgi:FKBP-type peptidyl-prolyl cis-trans isomerase 2